MPMPSVPVWKSYQRISLETAPPGKLVLMLYDGALKFLDLAILGFNSEDPLDRNEKIHNNVVKTQNILHELNATLDFEKGGELAQTLRDLYLYCLDRLREGNLKKEMTVLVEARNRINTLRDAWNEMLGQQANEALQASGVGSLNLTDE